MRPSALNLALVLSVLSAPALSEAGGGEGSGPSAVVSPGAPFSSTPRQATPPGIGLPPRLPGIYGRHTKPLDFGNSGDTPRYALGATGLTMSIYSTRPNGSPNDVSIFIPKGYGSLSGKLVSFEPRRGGSFIVEIQYREGADPVRYLIGRTGDVETLTQ